MIKKELTDIIGKYVNIKVSPDENLFGILYPVDLICIISDIEKQFNITVDQDEILTTRKINMEILNSIIDKKACSNG